MILRKRRMVARQTALHQAARFHGKHLTAPLWPSAFDQPQVLDRETKRFAQSRQVDLQAVVPLQETSRPKTQPRLSTICHQFNVTDRRAAMTHGIPIGDLLVLVRLHK